MGLKETSWFSLEVGWSGGCFVLVWQLVLLSLHNNLSAASQSFLFLPLYSLHLLLQVFITISSFRAAWYLLDVYYLPTDPDTSQLTAMVVGLVILILLRVTSCLHAGVSSDRPRSTYQYIDINKIQVTIISVMVFLWDSILPPSGTSETRRRKIRNIKRI